MSGGIYNIGDGFELENMEFARRVCALAGVPESQIAFVADRPGHDFRYGLRRIACGTSDGSRECRSTTGWRATVEWYRDHLTWLRRAHDVPVVTEPRVAGAGR